MIELLVSVSIISLAGFAFVALLTHSLQAWSTGNSKEEATSAATIALQKLAYDMRDGKASAISSDKRTITVTFPRLLTDPNTEESVYDPSSSDLITRSYYVSDGNLVRIIGSDITILARGIPASAITFGGLGGIVNVTIKQPFGSDGKIYEVTSQISLRNYRSN